MSLALAMALKVENRDVLLSEESKRFVVLSTAADLDIVHAVSNKTMQTLDDVWYQSDMMMIVPFMIFY
jgi:hypothetical protein